EATIARLAQELEASREHLQALSEQHDTVVQELQATTEEAQSSVEELQSINEELETSKEEIQSGYEELTTVNDELHGRNVELDRFNSDLTNLFNSVEVAVVLVDPAQRIRRFSPIAEKLLGILPGDIGRALTDIRMKIDFPQLDLLVKQAVERRTSHERELQAANGCWYLLRVRSYVTTDDTLDGAVLTWIDIDAVQRARAYAEHVVANVRHPLVVLDSELRVRLVNRSFCEVFQVSSEESQGRKLHELGNRQWDIPELRKLLEQVLPSENSIEDYEVSHDFERIGPKSVLVSARTFSPPRENDASILLSIQDITQQKQLEKQQAARIEELAQIDDSKNNFLAVLSHELRSPLNAIRNWVQALSLPGMSAEQIRHGLEVIDRNSRVQAELIADLVDAHRLATGKISLKIKEVDLNSMLELVVDSLIPAATAKQIQLRFETATRQLKVTADSNRLHQVFGNLIGNAIKFTPAQGKILVAVRASASHAQVDVTDSGAGIAPSSIPHLFEQFRQADPLTSRGQGGLGLGLSISKHLVELHGGVLEVRSAGKGKGSTFSVTLPLHSQGASARGALVPGPSQDQARILGGRIVLVVDDEVDAREPLRCVLESAGAEVLTVGSSEEALQSIQRQRPDVIVSDIGMPGHDGYELLGSIRSLPSERGGQIPAIALTAFAGAQHRERALRAGFQLHMTKPVESDRLIAAVAQLLAQSAQ
ncbi:MAG: ATP-binding protein, partial [Planctomycetota bacterium]